MDALLATKSDITDMDFTTSVFYAFMCKELLFSFEDVPPSLPPIMTKILYAFIDVLTQDVPPGLEPIRGIEYLTNLIPSASLHNRAP